MHASELWNSPGFGARLMRVSLFPASVLYALGWEIYLAMYRWGLKKPFKPRVPVICVGNLRVGGSGKTPVTLAIYRSLKARGHEVVVSCSGYGSPRSEEATIAPSGPLSADEWGDEAAMMRWLEPDLNLVVGRNRVIAARLIERSFASSIMLMDDGFQHLPLKKSLSILLDPEQPVNGFCLPAGPYREPRKNRSRADLHVPGDLQAHFAPTRLETPEGAQVQPKRYSVLCALGDPERFLEDLKRNCPPMEGFAEIKLLGDHDPISDGRILESFPKEIPIVVTAKDWVKLRQRVDCLHRTFLVATHRLELEPLDLVERRIEEHFTK